MKQNFIQDLEAKKISTRSQQNFLLFTLGSVKSFDVEVLFSKSMRTSDLVGLKQTMSFSSMPHLDDKLSNK